MNLTDAQIWALRGIAAGHGSSPATLGQYMMDRPGVEERRRGGNRNSRQGLGRIGGLMMERLRKMGLVRLYGWPTTAKPTAKGFEILQNRSVP